MKSGAMRISLLMVLVGCRPETPSPKPPALPDAASPPASTAAAPAAAAGPRESTPGPQARPAPPPVPLSDEREATLRQQVAALASDYPPRLEARRTLIMALGRAGRIDEAANELTALLDDVEREEGGPMAERVALAEAGTLQAQEAHGLAMRAYELLLARDPGGRFEAEAFYHLGECQVELREYADAEKTWQRLIEEHDGDGFAPWGWRKLALAQTLQGRFDEALATLDLMAAKYGAGEFGEYARMRKGYVQMAAGRLEAARESYSAFLAECRQSKYCALARRQLAMMSD